MVEMVDPVENGFAPVWWRRMRYFLSPQIDLYAQISRKYPLADTALDYGCGCGAGTIQLLSTNGRSIRRILEGVDRDPDAIGFASTTFPGVATWVCGDWVETGERFYQRDLVTAIEVLEHMGPEAQMALLRALLSAVEPGGALVVSLPNRRGAYRKNDLHVGELHVAEFRAMLEETAREYLDPGMWETTVTGFTLEGELADDSQVTPMVGTIRRF